MNVSKEGFQGIGPFSRTDSVQDHVTLCTSQHLATSTFTAECTSRSKSGNSWGDNHQGVATHDCGDEELLGLVVQFQRSSAPSATATTNKSYGKVMTTITETTGVRQGQMPSQTCTQWNEVTGSKGVCCDTVTVKMEQPSPLSSAWIDLGSAFESWHRIRGKLGLANNEDMASFLLQQYEDAPVRKWSDGCCVQCRVPLFCRQCGWTSSLPPTSTPLYSSASPHPPSDSLHVAPLKTESSMEPGKENEMVFGHNLVSHANHPIVYASTGTVDTHEWADNGSLVSPSVKELPSRSPSREGSLPEMPSEGEDKDSPQSPSAVSDSLTSASASELKCEVCRMICLDFEELSAHLQTHMNDVLYKCRKSWQKAGFTTADVVAPKNLFLTTQTEDVTSKSSFKRSATSEQSKRIRNQNDAQDATASQHSEKPTAEGPRRPVRGRRKRTGQVAGSAKTLNSVDVKSNRGVWGSEAVNETSEAAALKPAEVGFKASASDATASEQAETCVAASAYEVTTELPLNSQTGSGNSENQPAPKRKGFSLSRWLKEHEMQPSDLHPTECTQTPASEPLVVYVCVQCDAKFRHKRNLVEHQNKHSGERGFRCTECNSSFRRSSFLKQHMVTHSDDKPFACPHCSARFARSWTLKRHIITHSGNKPHKCELCAAAFYQRATLVSHMKVHTGDKPYDCTECGRTFARKTNLKRHLLTHSGRQ